MIEGWYSEEKLTAGHSLWEVKGKIHEPNNFIYNPCSKQFHQHDSKINKIMNKPDETWFSPLLQYSDGRLNVHHKQSTIRDMAE